MDARTQEEVIKQIIIAFLITFSAIGKSNACPARAIEKEKVADLMSATFFVGIKLIIYHNNLIFEIKKAPTIW